MKCPRCQQENPPQAKFCLECATPLALRCTNCGTELPAGAKFCFECATPVSAGGPAPRFAAPEVYTPKHLAERIINSKAALEGERKQVTLLFADLKGSMELLADRDPEEARKLLDPVLERMMEAVHRYEGTVNQVMGDGIMALFGAPLAHEDHAVRACYAALRMQEAVKRYAEEVHRTAGVPLHIRVGVNSGEVVVRSIGSDLHMDYTAVGQTTHLAARLEQMAMPGSILISPSTLNLAEGFVVVKPLGERPVKGLDSPIEVFEVVGAGAARSRLQAAAARGLTRFVGRDTELDQLRQALELARAGRGQVVAIVGEAGVGKSRLFWEFTHSHRVEGWLLIESSSISYGKATAFLPLIDLLRSYFQIDARDEARKMREKVTGKLLSLDRALEPSLPALLWLLDVPVDDAQWQRLDPPQRRQQTLDGIKRLLLRESQIQPLVLVFEDLHWIDAETQVLLDSVVESLPTARLLLLVNYRPEYQHAWGSKTYYRQLRIDPLPPESAGELLEAILGPDPSLEPVKRLLVERTEGNPFFLEECVRTLVEAQVVLGERGAYRLGKATQAIQVPATAQAILAARIDRLSPDDKRLLQAASVIGKDVPFGLLQAIAEVPEDVLRRGLNQLRAAEFLYEARLFPDLEYTFKHALTHDVAYGSLLRDRRRALHGQILDAFKVLYAERLIEQVERLGHHALHAERWKEAVTYLRQAGAKAATRSAHRSAVAHFEQALGALAHLPETRESLELAVDLRFQLRNSLFPLGEISQMLAHLHEAQARAERLGDPRRLAQTYAFLTNAYMAVGDHDRAVRSGQRALELGTEVGDFTLGVLAKYRLGQVHYTLGRHRQAIEFLRQAIAELTGDLVHERLGMSGFPAALARARLAMCYAETGQFVEGTTVGNQGLRIAETVADTFTLTFACMGLGHLYARQGAWAQAIAILGRGLDIARERDVPVLAPVMISLLAYAYALAGPMAEAEKLLERADPHGVSESSAYFQTTSAGLLGEACLLTGQESEARRLGSWALTNARSRQERGEEAWALRLLGEIATHGDPPQVEQAEVHYRDAGALALELGMLALDAHCHLGLGTLYRRVGKREEAQQHLATATTMYREMGMTYWQEKAEAEMRQAR